MELNGNLGNMENKPQNKIIVIGAGLGGISTALRLSFSGYKVKLIEKNSVLGGKISPLDQNGYKFDRGPSLITLPEHFIELYDDIGENIDDNINLVNLNPTCKYFFDNGKIFNYFSTISGMKKELNKINESFDSFCDFLNIGSKVYELSDKTFLNYPMGKFPSNVQLKDLISFPYIKSLKSYKKLTKSIFKSAEMRQIFERYTTYVGSSPEKTPGMFFIIPFIEFAFGSWYIKGGIYSLIKSLEKLLNKSNVEILKNTEIKKIKVLNNEVCGVETDKEFIEGNVVINNSDVSNLNQFTNKKNNENIDDYSLSGLIMLLGIKKKLHSEHHNILFSNNYNNEFKDLFVKKIFPNDPTVYLCNPVVTDKEVAPSGCSSLFIMANSTATLEGWSKKDIEEAKKKKFNKLSYYGFQFDSKDIEIEEVQTPNYFMGQHNSFGGSLYGKSSHGYINSFFRHPNKDKIKGLYNVGGTSHPGGGTPTVLKSSKITSDLIKNDY